MTTTTTAEARVGQALPPLAKSIDQRRIDVYSGVRPRSIHTDPDWAKARGFKAPLAQAMMSTAYVSELMMRLLGEGFVKGGTLSMAFIKPVFAGDPPHRSRRGEGAPRGGRRHARRRGGLVPEPGRRQDRGRDRQRGDR